MISLTVVLSCLQPSAAAKAGILLRLKVLSMLFATLDIKPRTENETESDDSEGSDMGTSTTVQQKSGSNEQLQPVYFVLERILPVMRVIIIKWYADTHIVQVGSDKLLFHFLIVIIRINSQFVSLPVWLS
jgi:hypothetical protein